jgi:hypothetical protein
MKTSVKIVVSLIFAFVLAMSCNSDDNTLKMDDDDVSQTDDDPTPGDGGGDGPTGSIELEQIEIHIGLPTDSGIDLSKTKVQSFLETFEVGADGSSKAYIAYGGPSFVYVTDEQDKLVLMGYVSKEHPDLNIKSMLEGALFFGLGTVVQPVEARMKFLDEFQDLPEIGPYVQELEAMYAADPTLLHSDSFYNWLNETATALLPEKEIIDMEKVLIDDTSMKSGVSVQQSDNDIFSVDVLNFWRRRAHAFLYKTEVKKEGSTGFEEILDARFIGSNNPTADFEQSVAPVTGLTSIQGNTMDIALGNGSNLGFTTNGPKSLPLLNDEVAAKYVVRIIGPGSGPGNHVLSSDEQFELNKLRIEALVLDAVIPIICNTIGITDIFKDSSNKFDIGPYTEAINVILASSPGVLDALDDGDLKTASVEFIKGVVANGSGTESFFKVLLGQLSKMGVSSASDLLTDEAALGKALAPLTIANAIMTATDIGRVFIAYQYAERIETFNVTISQSKVRIDPAHTGIVKGEDVDLTAKILDDADVQPGEYSFNWRTTGLYGSLKENPGTDTNVYESDPNAALPPNAKDSIFVEIRKDGSLVGKDSTTINISPTKYRIRPDGLTIKGGNNVKLSIVDEQAKRLVNDETVKYKVVWSTNGQYGKLNSRNIQVTTEEDHSVNYECFDKETENGVEGISAKIYYAIYDGLTQELSEYELYDEIQGEVNIKNDDDTLIFYVPVSVRSKPPTLDGNFWHWSTATVWAFKPVTEGIPEGMEIDRYYMDVIERVPSLIPDCANNSQTWYPGNEENDLDAEGTYSITCGVGAGSGHVDTWGRPEIQQYYSESLARQNVVKGYAQVTVYLKPKS